MTTPHIFGLVIIGSGLAGYTLAREYRKLDPDGSLLIITRDDGHNYSKPMLSTGLAKSKSADDLISMRREQMADLLSATILAHSQVEQLDIHAQTLRVGEQAYGYHKLVLATGAHCKQLDFPGAQHRKVFSINDRLDYHTFRAALGDSSRVLIMGGGLIGCEFANDLCIAGHPVSIVDPADTLLSGLLPVPASQALQQGLIEAGVDIRLRRSVQSITDSSDGLSIQLSCGTQLSADLVISAIGLRPNIGLAQDAGLNCQQGILVNRALETSAPNVYALGDCAQVDGQLLQYVMPLMNGARALAKTLAGTPSQVSYGVMPVATKTPACPVVVYPPQVSHGRWQFQQHAHNVVGHFREGELLQGFVLTGQAIEQKTTLSKLAVPIHN